MMRTAVRVCMCVCAYTSVYRCYPTKCFSALIQNVAFIVEAVGSPEPALVGLCQ